MRKNIYYSTHGPRKDNSCTIKTSRICLKDIYGLSKIKKKCFWCLDAKFNDIENN